MIPRKKAKKVSTMLSSINISEELLSRYIKKLGEGGKLYWVFAVLSRYKRFISTIIIIM